MTENLERTWDSTHQDAFDVIKEERTKTPALAYFNPKSELIFRTDALLKTFCTVLQQDGKPVIYVSEPSFLLRSMIPTLRENC